MSNEPQGPEPDPEGHRGQEPRLGVELGNDCGAPVVLADAFGESGFRDATLSFPGSEYEDGVVVVTAERFLSSRDGQSEQLENDSLAGAELGIAGSLLLVEPGRPTSELTMARMPVKPSSSTSDSPIYNVLSQE